MYQFKSFSCYNDSVRLFVRLTGMANNLDSFVQNIISDFFFQWPIYLNARRIMALSLNFRGSLDESAAKDMKALGQMVTPVSSRKTNKQSY